MPAVERPDYLRQLLSLRDKPPIKVITGVRHCGKSTLTAQFIQHLKEDGVTDDQNVTLNFEDFENDAAHRACDSSRLSDDETHSR